MLHAGELNRRITIERVNHAIVTGGDVEETTETQATVWAKKEDLSGSELFRAMQVHSEITTRFTIRWRGDIYPQMRVRLGLFEVFEIVAPPMDPDGRREQLQLLCKRMTVSDEAERFLLVLGVPVRV
jgi:SPP1 family predicted phage head-tail adaptor